MVHLEQAQPEQLQELLAFAEEAFRTPEGKVDFPTLLPKLYGPGADSAPLHTVLYEDGAPAGLYCLKIQDFNIAGTALRVGGIGTVCVDGRSRGKGHLALLMQDACCFSKRMRNFFRKNEKSVLQFCNKKPKRKGRLQRVEKSL